MHHVCGPPVAARERDDVLVVTVVRNGAFHLPGFLAHHRRLGVRHFLFCDNGSTDGTVAMLRLQPDVTLYRTVVPWRSYENPLKRHLVHKHSLDRWHLFVDVDELFDYPDRSTRPA